MGLLTAGYWPTTYWAKDYWPDDYWQDYGVVAIDPTGAKGRALGILPVVVHQSEGQSKALHDAGNIEIKGDERTADGSRNQA